MPEPKKKNLYQKLLEITEKVGQIDKTGKNTQQGYAFTEYSLVAAEVRAQMAKHGVMIIPETVDRRMAQVTNSKGTTFTQANVTSRYTLINAEDPTDRMVCEWDGGEALDTSDKATNKAITASAKNFYMKLFNISDKDDPDANSHQIDTKATIDPPSPEEPSIQIETPKVKTPDAPITESQVGLIEKMLKQKHVTKGADIKALIKLITEEETHYKELTKGGASTLIDYLMKHTEDAIRTDLIAYYADHMEEVPSA